jgi:putative nucleotidyltransferase with HDIG domain
MADRRAISPSLKIAQHVRFPIRTKITIPYLILSLILALAAAFVITQLVTENVQERFNRQLFESGKISSELIVGYETKLLETRRLLANVEGVPSAILSNDPDALRSLSLGIIANDQQEAVEFLDALGNHVLSIHHRPGGNPEDYEASTGGQTIFSNLEIVQNVINGLSDAHGDKFADLVKTDFGDFLYVSGPVYNAQNIFVGVVMVGRSLSTMAEDMRVKTFAQISFYNQSGQVIYSSLPFPHDLTPALAVQTISLKDVSSTTRDLSNSRDMTVANIPYSEILGSWEVRGGYQLGVLGVALSKNTLVATSTNSRWEIFLLVAFALFLIILLGFNLANSITRPLLRLVQASKEVAEGDLNVKLNAQSNDEVSVLTESFNKMVASLNQSHNELIQSYDETLKGWADALELRDKETEGHSERVTLLTIQLAMAMGIEGDALVNIRRGALLHDIGKMGTPDSVLHKTGQLNEEERKTIQKHPQDAYNMLNQIDYLRSALEIPYSHHEKWDGTGYPRGLKGKDIPISARIFAVVDVYDALTSDRVYRKAWLKPVVIKYLIEKRGSDFDPTVVDAFIRILNPA